ncbi:MAG: response regulator [Spirochaetaceae bacterium]|nr:response regulator [Spirochaetaceae bacterium]
MGDLNCTPIRFGAGEVESVVVTLQDLAPFEEVDRLRAEFLGMVGHELRAPLTSIKGSTAMALSSSRAVDPVEVRQFFRIIDKQADHMDGLISDLLDAGRLDTGTLSIAPEPAELTALVDQARNTFLSSGHQHPLHIDLPRELPCVLADPERIVQVLNNLLSNAAKHSPESSPISIAAVRDGLYVAVSVTDRGEGVPEERLPHLFRRYAAAPGNGKRGQRGSGLGLAISRGLVESHGGRIRADSGGAGSGTRITFTIPVASGAAAEACSDSSRLPRSEPSPARILVVDDDPQTLRYVRETLTEAGYAPLLTGDASALAEMIRAEQPRLVLLDLMLPGSDGIELMESVPELSDLPVIFISGYGRDETIARALEAGAADYIVKPFSPTELTARVRAALRRSDEPEPFVLGDLVIDYDQRRVTVAGHPVELTATEFELLRLLSLNPGRVLTHGSLLRQVWRVRGDSDTARVRSFMMKLRRKLGNAAACICNERGIGYRIARPDQHG